MQSAAIIWQQCTQRLACELTDEDFNTWIRPLQLISHGGMVSLFAPNRYVLEHIHKNFLDRIVACLSDLYRGQMPEIQLKVGNQINNISTHSASKDTPKRSFKNPQIHKDITYEAEKHDALFRDKPANKPNPLFNFNNFVEGKSNQLARAAAMQVADNLGVAYNPLFIYGGVGLGKTHLMHAIGNHMLAQNQAVRILYLHSESFVGDMVRAMQRNAMNTFKRYYRSANALLIDDIQFFAGKDRSQEELFHTFNSMLDSKHQIILTCDRYPKELNRLEERLKSRFGWGLTVAVEPPDLETRVAILMSKAEQFQIVLSDEVAFFMGKRIQSNVRELEGALRRVMANAHLKGEPITVPFVQGALQDLLAVRARLVTIDNIQKTVADFYKIKLTDLVGTRRIRSLVRARQIAMALAKELTNHSLPTIGEAFGGRDHTTVLHACKKIKELIESDAHIAQDYKNLLRVLST